ncbi:hypothetical protein LXA43DRAFT_904424, partial [Ganoderma leucocontextum]
AFIPSHLEARTQVLLRMAMQSRPAASDGTGYIYALKLVDTAHPDIVRIKVGRSVHVCRRISEHRRRCPSFKPRLLGTYPPATHGIYPIGVRYSHLLERLVHLELTDLAAQSNPAHRKATRPRCQDCGSRHVEIFTFKRMPGTPVDWHWQHVIRAAFQRWGRFVTEHVA